jgi:NAD(P)-dependent dehydrogenase (short-subunit alcohol dehydrogenase family)
LRHPPGLSDDAAVSAAHGDRMRLDGKAAVITGAGGGIGRAIAVEFAAAGAKVVLTGRNEEMLAETAAALDGAEAHVVVADVSQSADVRRLVADAVNALGAIDVLVNNHGVEGRVVRLADYPEEEFDRVIAINLRGTFLLMQHVLPIMVERGAGSIVNLGSVASERGLVGTSAYIASKHGILGLTRCAAAEYGNAGVRINAINAGMVDTRMLRAICAAHAPDDVEGMLAEIAGVAPLARLASPEEVAAVALFLASDAASFVNGAAWEVDGGALNTMGGGWT